MLTLNNAIKAAGVLALLVLAFLALRVETINRPYIEHDANALKAVIAGIPLPAGAVRVPHKMSYGSGYGRHEVAHYRHSGPSGDVARHYDAVLLSTGWTPCKVPTPFGKPEPAGLPKGYTKSGYEVTLDYVDERVARDPLYYVAVRWEADKDGCRS